MEHETKKSLKRLRKPAIGVLTVAVIAGVGFYGGVAYQKHHAGSTNLTARTAGAQKFGGRGFGGELSGSRADRVVGQVTAVSSTSITVAAQSGSSTTLAISSSTTITDNGQAVTANDIAVGDTVFITENSSNTSQAARIMVNPSFGGPMSQSQSGATTQSD